MFFSSLILSDTILWKICKVLNNSKMFGYFFFSGKDTPVMSQIGAVHILICTNRYFAFITSRVWSKCIYYMYEVVDTENVYGVFL